jgi:hypothetical protein
MLLKVYQTILSVVRYVDKRIALIIFLYFSISLFNIASKQDVEWFPLFSFKLYSRIPDGFTRYDIIFDQGSPNERYLLHRNGSLNALERRSYEHWLSSSAGRALDISSHQHLFNDAGTASLVKMSGDFVQAVTHSDFKSEFVTVIK